MKASQDQWPHCAEHSQCPYQLLLLSPKCTSSRILCTECLYSKENVKCKDEILQTIPLSIAFQSPDLMIDQMINNQGNTNFKGLFKICELELDKLFNAMMFKFLLPIIHKLCRIILSVHFAKQQYSLSGEQSNQQLLAQVQLIINSE